MFEEMSGLEIWGEGFVGDGFFCLWCWTLSFMYPAGSLRHDLVPYGIKLAERMFLVMRCPASAGVAWHNEPFISRLLAVRIRHTSRMMPHAKSPHLGDANVDRRPCKAILGNFAAATCCCFCCYARHALRKTSKISRQGDDATLLVLPPWECLHVTRHLPSCHGGYASVERPAGHTSLFLVYFSRPRRLSDVSGCK